jgi:hypothetical protein
MLCPKGRAPRLDDTGTVSMSTTTWGVSGTAMEPVPSLTRNEQDIDSGLVSCGVTFPPAPS